MGAAPNTCVSHWTTSQVFGAVIERWPRAGRGRVGAVEVGPERRQRVVRLCRIRHHLREERRAGRRTTDGEPAVRRHADRGRRPVAVDERRAMKSSTSSSPSGDRRDARSPSGRGSPQAMPPGRPSASTARGRTGSPPRSPAGGPAAVAPLAPVMRSSLGHACVVDGDVDRCQRVVLDVDVAGARSPLAIVAGAHGTSRLTPPWARMNATGTCSDRVTLRVVDWRRPIAVSTWAPTAASRPSMVTCQRHAAAAPDRERARRDRDPPARPGRTAGAVPQRAAGDVLTVRSTLTMPGITGALIDGMLRSTAAFGSSERGRRSWSPSRRSSARDARPA